MARTRNLLWISAGAFAISATFTLASFHPTINVLNGTPYNNPAQKQETKKVTDFCKEPSAKATSTRTNESAKLFSVKHTPCP